MRYDKMNAKVNILDCEIVFGRWKFIILLFLFCLPVVFADELSYSQVNKSTNLSYDSLNRLSLVIGDGNNASYFYDDGFDGVLSNVSFGNFSVVYDQALSKASKLSWTFLGTTIPVADFVNHSSADMTYFKTSSGSFLPGIFQ